MIRIVVQTSPQIEARPPLARQRALADLAEASARDGLGSPALSWSRSHSRGLGAAVVSSAVSKLGLDLELADPARPWREVLDYLHEDLCGDVAPTPQLGCSVWTLHEAWYKAFGAFAGAEILSQWLRAPPPLKETVALTADIHAWRARLDEFEICLVWEGPALPVAMRVLDG